MCALAQPPARAAARHARASRLSARPGPARRQVLLPVCAGQEGPAGQDLARRAHGREEGAQGAGRRHEHPRVDRAHREPLGTPAPVAARRRHRGEPQRHRRSLPAASGVAAWPPCARWRVRCPARTRLYARLLLPTQVPMALRMSGHLMLGVVRIFSRKVTYLLSDCSEAMVKIKDAFRGPGGVDMAPGAATRRYDDITNPEHFDEMDLDSHFVPAQARLHPPCTRPAPAAALALALDLPRPRRPTAECAAIPDRRCRSRSATMRWWASRSPTTSPTI
eukprot:scaffold40272_cov68-Phaeocystis_antarctica.AAC.3